MSKLNPRMVALVLVNVQNDFAKEKGVMSNQMHNGEEAMTKIVQVVTACRKAGVMIVHAPQDSLEFYKPVNHGAVVGNIKILQDNKALLPESWGVKICEDVLSESDVVVKGKKGMDAFASLNLLNVLQEKEIRTVVVCGFTANGGVYSTACSAYNKGFEVYTIADCSAAESAAAHKASINLLSKVSKISTATQFMGQFSL
mmetsp:Transcript_173/g.372  ORF Transcript_173/g.372 Transcript_173/m.372 type:complete len:200 (+) Transcript_173:23-622(+)|eukprot:CAMPEP_0175151024 /NCGR_PEP_ID=MMETSP0087-20121206/18238_1 /TAXON_ID=136419 /ORGANISM="Unknown Unknown, Strain D1" /LENGTH=199 /DNA_ID=CAMNT_0016437119 /DNA_START=18 /DNA_END=617 /DNA_ORIENTATION=-